jgi:hypothetical protein
VNCEEQLNQNNHRYQYNHHQQQPSTIINKQGPFVVIVFYLIYRRVAREWVVKDKTKYRIIFHVFIAFMGVTGGVDFAVLACGNPGARGEHVRI